MVPFPKNPAIARVFKEIGRADELGSGTRNLFKYCKAYSGNDPQLLEEDVFHFILNLTPQVTPQAAPQAAGKDHKKQVLEYCKEPRTREEIQAFLGLKDREHLRREIIKPLLEKGTLKLENPEKPRSPKQRYYTAKKNKKAKKKKVKK